MIGSYIEQRSGLINLHFLNFDACMTIFHFFPFSLVLLTSHHTIYRFILLHLLCCDYIFYLLHTNIKKMLYLKPKKMEKQAKREGTVQSVGDFCEDSLDGDTNINSF